MLYQGVIHLRIPQIMAGAALTFGLANVAQIKSQSFEGGGFTGYGARAGGLDGKGGRMAMIHPNETVIDHRKGGAAGITIVNNVDARGAGADVDQKIKAAMTQTSQQTIMTIQDLKRRGRSWQMTTFTFQHNADNEHV